MEVKTTQTMKPMEAPTIASSKILKMFIALLVHLLSRWCSLCTTAEEGDG